MNEFLQPKTVMRRRPNPLLTVVYPAVDVRGPAVQRLRTWTQGQTLPREAYRVIVGWDCKKPSEESELASLLAATDELIRLPNASDTELWNEAALRANSPWLLFTEGPASDNR